MKFNHKLWAAVTICLITLGLTGCKAAAQSPTTAPLKVVASTDFYGEVAEAVLGKHGQVTTMIRRADIDPHDYQPTTADGRAVAEADVVLYNGAGYDTWLSRLAASNEDATQVAVAQVMAIEAGANEHLWYQPETMTKLALKLAEAYSQRDAKHQATYRRNAQAYIASLKPLQTQIAQLKAKATNQQVAVSEPLAEEALRALGYRISNHHFAQAIEESSDPSVADVKQLHAAIAEGKLAFFVQNTQVQSKVVADIAKRCQAAGIPVWQITETMPKGKDYRGWMGEQYRALAEIQKRH